MVDGIKVTNITLRPIWTNVYLEPGEKIYLYSEGSHLLIEPAQVPSPSKNYNSIA